jgi:hypothetical protein
LVWISGYQVVFYEWFAAYRDKESCPVSLCVFVPLQR